MKAKKKQNKEKKVNEKEVKRHKLPWVTYFAIVGWAGVVFIWVWQAIKLLLIADTGKGLLYLAIAFAFAFIGVRSTLTHINRGKIENKEK